MSTLDRHRDLAKEAPDAKEFDGLVRSGLAEDEVAFYDAVAQNAEGVYDEPFLRDLVHDVVQTIKRNLKVDWTEPHRDQVRAEIRAAVKRVLRKRGVREADFEPFIARFIQQAEAQYAEWPLVA